MNILSFVLVILTLFAFNTGATDMPTRTDRAYAIVIEAGAKLLEFDIIRENLNIEQKQLVAITDREKYYSSAGKAISAMWSIEEIAPSFDEVVPLFLNLQSIINDVNEDERWRIVQSVKGLILLLDNPEILHVIMPLPQQLEQGYLEAMKSEATLNFVKSIQTIVQNRYLECSCDKNNQNLPQVGYLFYSIIKQTLINVFAIVIENTSKPKEKVVAESAKQVKTVMDPKSALYAGILHDSPEEINLAIANGANPNDGYMHKGFIEWAIQFAKPNAVKALIDLGSHSRPFDYSLKIGDLHTAAVLIKKNECKWTLREDPLLKAIMWAHVDLGSSLEFIEELIKCGYNLAGTGRQDTVWEVAFWHRDSEAQNGYRTVPLEVLALFIKNGANPNQSVYANQTPLIMAIGAKNIDAVKLLLEKGADVNANIVAYNYRQKREIHTTILDHTIDLYNLGSDQELKKIIDILKEYGGKVPANEHCLRDA